MRRVLRSSLALAFGLGLAAALPAGPARAGDPARDLGDIDSAGSKDVDDANTAEAKDLDAVTGDGAEDAHIVDSDSPDAAATATEPDPIDSTALDAAETAPNEWVPPACDGLPHDLGPMPPAEDVDAWRGAIQDAAAAIDRTRTRLASADAEYTYARNRKSPRGEALRKILDARDKARDAYAQARCNLPARIEYARKIGVAPEAWRDFPASID